MSGTHARRVHVDRPFVLLTLKGLLVPALDVTDFQRLLTVQLSYLRKDDRALALAALRQAGWPARPGASASDQMAIVERAIAIVQTDIRHRAFWARVDWAVLFLVGAAWGAVVLW